MPLARSSFVPTRPDTGYNRRMPFPAFLLRCLLALALLASGVPTFTQAPAVLGEAVATASCHDMEAAAPQHGADEVPAHDCCGTTNCQCDCLHHMPVVAVALPPLALPMFGARAPVLYSLPGNSRVPPASLRPPIA